MDVDPYMDLEGPVREITVEPVPQPVEIPIETPAEPVKVPA